MAYSSLNNTAGLIGRLTRDPELRAVSTSAGDTSVLTLCIAVRKPRKPNNEEAPTADFFYVTVWGPEAENCVKYLRKGRLVAVAARLEPTSWKAEDGSTRRGMEIIATAVEFLDRPTRDTDSEKKYQEVPIAA